jgi:hypothetical protein
MRGLFFLCSVWLPVLTTAFASIEASAETAPKTSKLRGAATPAAAAAPAPAAASPPPSAVPATTTAAPVPASASAPQGATPAPAAGAQPGEGAHITWSTPFTLERVSASIGPEFGSDDLNLGLGIRAGYTIRQSVYFGVLGDYWLGTSQEATVPGAGTIKASAHAWDVFGDIGYDLAPSPTIVLRPFVGFGIYGAFGEACTSAPGAATTICVSSHGSKGAGLFGGQVLVDLGGINLGGELRLLIVGDVAAVIAARVGTTF